MDFQDTSVAGCWRIATTLVEDERGSFARAFEKRQFEARGLETSFVQSNVAFSRARATLRGLHLQTGSHAEAKLVRCVQGAAYDVVVDLRPESPTYRRWHGMVLSARNHLAVYAPPGTAHGYLTLEEDTRMLYHVSQEYEPAAEIGIRWDDPDIGIGWPIEPAVMSDRDRALPTVRDIRVGAPA